MKTNISLNPNESALVVNVNTGTVRVGITKNRPKTKKVKTSELMLLAVYDLLLEDNKEFKALIENKIKASYISERYLNKEK